MSTTIWSPVICINTPMSMFVGGDSARWETEIKKWADNFVVRDGLIKSKEMVVFRKGTCQSRLPFQEIR